MKSEKRRGKMGCVDGTAGTNMGLKQSLRKPLVACPARLVGPLSKPLSFYSSNVYIGRS